MHYLVAIIVNINNRIMAILGLGSAIGGAMKIGGAIFGGISQARAAKKVKENIEGQQQENQDWYDRRYNEDMTQRADAQRLLSLTEESIRNRNKQAAATAAVMGGTNESLAAQRAANAASLTDTMSQIAVTADARKDAIENQYRAKSENLNASLNDLETKKAENISAAIQGVAGAAADVASIDNLFKKG